MARLRLFTLVTLRTDIHANGATYTKGSQMTVVGHAEPVNGADAYIIAPAVSYGTDDDSTVKATNDQIEEIPHSWKPFTSSGG